VDQRETQATPSYDELERALSSVPGIVTASVAVSEGTGRGRLRIRLAPGEDPEQIAWAVAATLRERFGISLDPDTIRPRLLEEDARHPRVDEAADEVGPGPLDQPREIDATDDVRLAPGDLGEDLAAPPPAFEDRPRGEERPRRAGAAAAGTGTEPPVEQVPASAMPAGVGEVAGAALAASAGPRVRAAIRDLVTRHGDDDVEVTATLEVGDRRGRAAVRAVPTRRGIWRAVAEATVAALRELTGDHLRAGVDRISVASHEDPGTVTVVLTVLSDRGEETLLGASLLRDDPQSAVMRATLDALNRRVEPLLRSSASVAPTA
jgi:hypothetical protein